MMDRIREFFESRIRPAAGEGEHGRDEHALHLATASLLVEMVKADYRDNEREREVMQNVLQRFTDLDADELATLTELADEEVRDATSLYQFTRLIDQELPYSDKVTVIEMLWQVAYADGHKDKHEEYLVRKVADLLHVSHRDFIRARHRIEEQS